MTDLRGFAYIKPFHDDSFESISKLLADQDGVKEVENPVEALQEDLE